MKVSHINKLIQKPGINANEVSDGYHTFGELYDHRIALFIMLCHMIVVAASEGLDVFDMPWKSKLHNDGTSWEGWFIAGIGQEKGNQISYHLPMDKWDKLDVLVLARAPEWDGHTSADVIERLYKLI